MSGISALVHSWKRPAKAKARMLFMPFRNSLTRLSAVITGTLLRKTLRRRVRRSPELAAPVEHLLVAYREGHLPDPGAGFGGWTRFLLHHCYRNSGDQYFRSLARVHRIAIKSMHEPVWRTCRTGVGGMRLNIANVAEWSLYILGEHDPGVAYWLGHFADRRSVFVDVGANVGIFTLQLARRLTPENRIVAFEPNPEVYRELMGNLERNDLVQRVSVHAAALGDEPASMTLTIPMENIGGASLARGAGNGGGSGTATVPKAGSGSKPGLSGVGPCKQVQVPVIRFDDWWREGGCCRITLLKIDVEGHELAVLRGMLQMLRSQRPVLIVEVTYEQAHAASFEALFRALDYRLRQVVAHAPYAQPLRWQPGGGQMDVLCEPV